MYQVHCACSHSSRNSNRFQFSANLVYKFGMNQYVTALPFITPTQSAVGCPPLAYALLPSFQLHSLICQGILFSLPSLSRCRQVSYCNICNNIFWSSIGIYTGDCNLNNCMSLRVNMVQGDDFSTARKNESNKTYSKTH